MGRGSPQGLARASVICLGLAATTAGFVRAKLARLLTSGAP